MGVLSVSKFVLTFGKEDKEEAVVGKILQGERELPTDWKRRDCLQRQPSLIIGNVKDFEKTLRGAASLGPSRLRASG